MDEDLKQLMGIAAKRGNNYIKGAVPIERLPEKIAELGVFLLEEARRIQDFDTASYKYELKKVQNKVDDLRKVLFAHKIKGV